MLGQPFGSRDGRGGEGLKPNVPCLVLHQMCKEGYLRCWGGEVMVVVMIRHH